jgi:hypothetical protein
VPTRRDGVWVSEWGMREVSLHRPHRTDVGGWENTYLYDTCGVPLLGHGLALSLELPLHLDLVALHWPPSWVCLRAQNAGTGTSQFSAAPHASFTPHINDKTVRILPRALSIHPFRLPTRVSPTRRFEKRIMRRRTRGSSPTRLRHRWRVSPCAIGCGGGPTHTPLRVRTVVVLAGRAVHVPPLPTCHRLASLEPSRWVVGSTSGWSKESVRPAADGAARRRQAASERGSLQSAATD